MIRTLRSLGTWLGQWRRQQLPSARNAPFVPALEPLEDRRMPSYVPTGPLVDVTDGWHGTYESSSRTVAEMSNGNYRVVWQEPQGAYTRLFAANGTPLGNAWLDNPNVGVSEATVAMNDQGIYVIAETEPFYGHSAVQFNVYDAKGEELANNLIMGGLGDYHQPSVAIDSAGNYVIACSYSYPNSVSTVKVFTGSAFSNNPAKQVDWIQGGTGDSDYAPSVAMNAGGFVVAWAYGGHGSQYIYARRYNTTGQEQGQDVQVTYSTHWLDQPSVAIDAKGDFVVAYTFVAGTWMNGSNQVYYQTEVHAAQVPAMSQNAIPFTVFASPDPTQPAYAPSAAMDGKGNFVIAYVVGGSYGPGYGENGIARVLANAYSATGKLRQSNLDLAAATGIAGASDYGDITPSVALSATGRLVAVWEDFEVYGPGAVEGTLYAQTFTDVQGVNPHRPPSGFPPFVHAQRADVGWMLSDWDPPWAIGRRIHATPLGKG
jgi:hypothetical protein